MRWQLISCLEQPTIEQDLLQPKTCPLSIQFSLPQRIIIWQRQTHNAVHVSTKWLADILDSASLWPDVKSYQQNFVHSPDANEFSLQSEFSHAWISSGGEAVKYNAQLGYEPIEIFCRSCPPSF